MIINTDNFKIESIHSGILKERNTIVNRKKSSIIFRKTGTVHYEFPDFSADVHPGDMIFLPKGSSYNYITLSSEPSEYIAVKFEAEILRNTPFVYSLEAFSGVEEISNNITELWKFGSIADHYKCYSVVYNLLYYIKTVEAATSDDTNKHRIISPAISYLKTHIYSHNLKIENLSKICGISGTYFRKIFQLKYGVSPQKYILSKRISHAKALIDNGDFESISEVANQVGFSDPLYFSRMFKKAYGVSPSQYAKE